MSLPEFEREVDRALRYSAGPGTVDALLTYLQTTPHNHSLLAHPNSDPGPRLVTADALQDDGRDEEAKLLRDHTKPVVIRDGQVHRGRFTLEYVYNRLRDAERLLQERFEYPDYWSPLSMSWNDTRDLTDHPDPASELRPNRRHEGYAQIWNRYPELPDLHEYIHVGDLGKRLADDLWDHVSDELSSRSNNPRRDKAELIRSLDAIRSAPVVEPLPKK